MYQLKDKSVGKGVEGGVDRGREGERRGVKEALYTPGSLSLEPK